MPYYKIKPQMNEILRILNDLDSFDLNVMDVEKRIKENYLLQFPEIMKHLQLIIEFSDCIIQGKDLINFDIVIDEDQERARRTAIERAAKQATLMKDVHVQGK